MKKNRLKYFTVLVLALVAVLCIALFSFGCAEQGPKGDKGEQGIAGPKGDQGSKGENGEDGKDGEDGEDGADGKSAYELYVEGLAEGETPLTEEEWLESLGF